MTTDQQIEMLRQQNLHLMAQVATLETTTRILFAMIASYDGRPDLRDKLVNGIFPMMMQAAVDKKYEGSPPELAQWLVQRETQLLQQEFAAILEGIDTLRQKAARTLN